MINQQIKMINTIYGEADETTLRKVEGTQDYPDAIVDFVEYYNDKDEMVHRSAIVNVKNGFIGGALLGQIGG